MFDLKNFQNFLKTMPRQELLKEAFTHRTYAVEHNLNYDNQRLEFLGDAVVDTILSEYIFLLYADLPEGDLTKLRSALVCEGALAQLARRINLAEDLRIGHGENESGGAFRDSTLADLFEAVFGAIYLACGMEICRKGLTELFAEEFPDPRQMLVKVNPKGKLQELSQHFWNRTPSYRVFSQSGPQHDPFYEVEVLLMQWVARGSGKNRKAAEGDAARNLYNFLHKKGIRF